MESTTGSDRDDQTDCGIAQGQESKDTDILLGSADYYSASRARWGVLGGFFLCVLSSMLTMLTFSPVDNLAARYLNQDSDFINLQTVVFYFSNLIGTLPSAAINASFGIRFSVLVGAGLNAAGCCLRCIVVQIPRPDWAVSLLTLGQILAAIGQPFLLSCPTQLAATWFPADELVMATSVGYASSIAGAAIAWVVPSAYLDGVPDRFGTLLLSHAGIASIAFVLALILIRGPPERPPSASAALASREPRSGVKSRLMQLWSDLQLLAPNKDFLLLTVAGGLLQSMNGIFGALLPQMMRPFGFDNRQTGWFALSAMGSGVIGTIVMSLFGDKVRVKARIILPGILMVTAVLGGFGLLMNMGSLTVFLGVVLNMGMGAVFQPLVPLCFDLAADYTYPVPASSAQGSMVAAGQLAGGMGVLALQGLVGHGQGGWAYIICGCITLSALPLIALLSERRSRSIALAERASGLAEEPVD